MTKNWSNLKYQLWELKKMSPTENTSSWQTTEELVGKTNWTTNSSQLKVKQQAERRSESNGYWQSIEAWQVNKKTDKNNNVRV